MGVGTPICNTLRHRSFAIEIFYAMRLNTFVKNSTVSGYKLEYLATAVLEFMAEWLILNPRTVML